MTARKTSIGVTTGELPHRRQHRDYPETGFWEVGIVLKRKHLKLTLVGRSPASTQFLEQSTAVVNRPSAPGADLRRAGARCRRGCATPTAAQWRRSGR